MTTPAEWLHLQPQERHLSQQAAAIAAGCFPAFRDHFLSHYPIIPDMRAANREVHHSVREL